MRDKAREHWVELGSLSGVHGVRGGLKLYSWTRPRAAIFEYRQWFIGDEFRPVELEKGIESGKHLVVTLKGVSDRDQAAALVGQSIFVPRDALPEPESGSYYWADLEGLQVVNRQGEELGTVRRLLETGAHDVLELQGEREILIPFVPGQVVLNVDLSAGRIEVDWDAHD